MKFLKLNSITALILLLVTSFTNTNAQNINFLDVHLKTVLVNDLNINTNGDSEIQKSEAMSYTGGLNLDNIGLYNLSGVEYFLNVSSISAKDNQLTFVNLSNNKSLKKLDLRNNKLSEIDLTELTELVYLDLSNNYISNLDLQANNSLEVLKCSNNLLTSLELFDNLYIITLDCNYNQIEELDLSHNENLEVLYCVGNGMSSLDLSNNNNTSIGTKNIDIRDNELNCIQVDDVQYANNNWGKRKDFNSYYSVDCNHPQDFETTGFDGLTVFPNPATDVLNINMGEISSNVDVEILNNVGNVVMKNNYAELDYLSLNLDLTSGVYLVNVKTENGKQESVKLIVK